MNHRSLSRNGYAASMRQTARRRNVLRANRPMLVVLLLLLTVVPLLLTTQPVFAAPSLELTQTVDTSTGSNEEVTGTYFSFKFQYRCASTTENCRNVVLQTDPLPDAAANALAVGAGDVIQTGSPHVASMNYDDASRVATWQFIDPLPAGSTGEITLRVKFKDDGTCRHGTPASVGAIIDGDNASSASSGPIEVTARAQNTNYKLSKARSAGSFLVEDDAGNPMDATVTYRIQACQPPNSTQGGLNLQNITMRDTLPADAIVEPSQLSGTAPSYTFTDSKGNTGTYNSDDDTISWNLPDLNVGDPCIERFVTLIYPTTGATPPYSQGDFVQNSVELSGTPIGESQITRTSSTNDELVGPLPEGSIVKSVSHPKRHLGGSLTYTIKPSNSGNVPLDAFIVVDEVPAGIDVTQVKTHVVDGQPIVVSYSTDAGAPYTWTELATYPGTGTSDETIDASALAPTALKWDYGTVPVDFNGAGGDGTGFVGTIKNDGSVSVGDTIQNTARLTSDDLATPEEDTASTEIIKQQPRPVVKKSIASGNPANNGSNVRYRLTLTNPSYTDTPLSTPVLADFLSPYLEYVGNETVSGSAGAPAPGVQQELDYKGSGQDLIRWRWDGVDGAPTFDLPAGQSITLEFDVRVKDNAPGGTDAIGNTAGLIRWGPTPEGITDLDACPNKDSDTYDLDDDTDILEKTCFSDSSDLDVSTIVLLESILEVKGQLDSDWNRFPDYGRTVPGGDIEYRLFVENIGNIPVRNMRILDIMPYVGDTGVIDVIPRGTEWRPQFTELIVVPAGVTVYYSTKNNPERTPDFLPVNPPGAQPANWSTTPPADSTTVSSVLIDFDDTVLNPRDKIEVRWRMQAPADVPNALIAWNSFGYVGERTDTSTDTLPSEPIKVGIVAERSTGAEYGNYVWFDGDKNGVQDGSENGVNLVRVELYSVGPDGSKGGGDDVLIDTTYTANNHAGDPGYYRFANLSPGNYYARFTPPSGYDITLKDVGSDNDLDSDVDTTDGTTSATTLLPGESDLSWDMGLVAETTAVGNYVWFDRNGDGIQNEAPSDGINGVTVRLLDGSGSELATTTTANDLYGNPGYYLFDDLDPALTYEVEFVKPVSHNFTTAGAGADDEQDSDADTTTGRTGTFTLVAGQYDDTWDAGLIDRPTGDLSLGNLVWIDTNRNGTRDTGESGVDGVAVNLYRDSDSSGDYSVGDEFVTTMKTYTNGGNPGYYRFNDLAAGDYIVQIDPSNFTSSGVLYNYGSSPVDETNPNDDGNNNDNGLDTVGAGVTSGVVTLADDSEPINDGDLDTNSNLSVDFGFYQLPRLGDYVWLDSNNNNRQDASESGVNGVVVNLYKGGSLIKTTVTANDASGNAGYYLFEGLTPANDYEVEFVPASLPAGATFVNDNVGGDDARDSDADTTNGKTGSIDLSTVDEDLTWDAGIQITFSGSLSLGNLVWYDQDNNGQVNGSESGIQDVVVNLYRDSNSNGVFDSGDLLLASDTTDNAGLYGFTGLDAGDYFVQIAQTNFNTGGALEDKSANSTYTESNPDANDNRDNGEAMAGRGVVSNLVTLTAAGEPATGIDGDDTDGNQTIDFGFYQPASLGDYVWIDADRDGVQDGDEYGLSAVTVRLYDTSDNEIDTTVTDANGYYIFEDIVPGDYYVKFFAPPGYTVTDPDQTADDNDSDASIADGTTGTITLAEGEHNPDIDAGMYAVVGLGNRIWLDTDNDGKYEPGDGEQGVNGVVVNLYKDTNGNGKYTPGTDQFVRTTTTADDTSGVPGYYIFPDIADGEDYIVQVDGSNFDSGAVLERYGSSKGNPDPDNDTDHDDNGAPYNSSDLTDNGVVARAVTLNSGTEPLNDGDANSRTNLTVDFGFFPYVSLGDYVWEDADNNGLQDDGASAGIGSVVVNLYRDSNDDGTPDGGWGNVIATTTTDGSGYYFFDKLQPGTYFVQIPSANFNTGKPLEGFNNSTGQENGPATADLFDSDVDSDSDNDDDNGSWHSDQSKGVVSRGVTLANDDEPTGDGDSAPVVDNDSNRTVDFGFYRLLSLGNRVWRDDNNSGTQDGSEPGIEKVKVKLYRDSDNDGTPDGGWSSSPLKTTTTDASGDYLFTDLQPGHYIVQIPSSEFQSGNELAGLRSSTGQGIGRADSDTPEDPDDSDTDNDDNGKHHATPDNGVVSQPVTLELDNEPDTADDGDDTQGNMTVDFGFHPLMSLGNRVWHDIDNDGNYESGDGEVGINGVVVNLYHDTNGNGSYDDGTDLPVKDGAGANLTTATADDGSGDPGFYQFTNLLPGNYIVQIADSNFGTGKPLDSFYSSSAEVPADDPDNNGNHDDNGEQRTANGVVSQAITLELGKEPDTATDGDGTLGNTTVDFGFHRVLSLGNRVWHDSDNDAVYEPGDGEEGINGITLSLYYDTNGNGSYDDGTDLPVKDGGGTNLTTTTADDGSGNPGFYQFSDLVPGNYIVLIDDPNFDAGNILEDFNSSTGNDITTGVAPDPDPAPAGLEQDGDDNGNLRQVGIGIASKAVTLIDGNEPDTATDGDNTQSNMTVDFGVYGKVRIGNLIWHDQDNDGIWDDGIELGKQGVKVNLYQDSDNDGTPDDWSTPLKSTTTDDNGLYLFDQLDPGHYIVQVDASNFVSSGDPLYGFFTSTGNEPTPDPDDNADDDDNGDNHTDTANGVVSQPVTVYSGEEPDTPNDGDDIYGNMSVDFGFYEKVWLGNLVWHDINNNGVREDNEPGIADVELNLYIDNDEDGVPDSGWDTPVQTQTTDQDGAYLFDDLDPNIYMVQVDAGNFSEPGKPLSRYLSSTGNQPTPDPDSDTDNNDNGDPHATDPDSYGVVSQPVTIYHLTEPDTDVDGDGTNGNMTLDFGFYQKVALGDHVWHDQNNNGKRDKGEPGIDGVTVKLYLDSDNDNIPDSWTTPISETVTSDDGRYAFRDLDPGHYIVQVDAANFTGAGQLVSYVSSSATVPAPDPDDDTNRDDNGDPHKTASYGIVSKAVTIYNRTEPGKSVDGDGANNNQTVDFGFHRKVSLGNRIWNDLDNDGIYEPGDNETGINTVTVNLYGDSDGNGIYTPNVDEFLGSTTTANDADGVPGYYIFDDLLPGRSYIVQVDSANFAEGSSLYGFTSTTGNGTASDPDNDTDHDDNGDPSDDAEQGTISRALTLIDAHEPTDDGDTSDQTNLTLDFGFYELATVGDYVWADLNRNGTQESDEPGLTGVTVELYNSKQTLVGTTTTDSNGRYEFKDLVPGNYLLVFTPPDGYAITGREQGGDTTTDSNADTESGATSTFTLEVGDHDMTWDAGMHIILSLGNRVWFDVDNDGIYEPGDNERGINNVTVKLYRDSDGSGDFTPDTDEFVATTTTADDSAGMPGYYIFEALEPGDYVVQIEGANFDPFGPLTQLSNSTGNDVDGAAPDPDNDVNHDDNGDPYGDADYGVVSTAVTLSHGDEPTNDGDTDAQSNMTVDFGFYLTDAELTSIGDRVWLDTNANGKQDSGEPGVPNVTVSLYTAQGELVGTTTTSGNGYYTFIGLTTGDYYLVFAPPEGYTITEQNQGSSDEDDSDADTQSGTTSITTLDKGEHDTTWDVGLITNDDQSGDGDGGDQSGDGDGTEQIGIDIDKDVSLDRIVPQQVVRFTLTVTNTSDTMVLSPVSLTDALPEGLTYITDSETLDGMEINERELTWPDISDGAGLQPGEVVEVSFLASVTTEIGLYTNIATVEGRYPGGSVTETDDAVVDVEDPTVEVDKRAATDGLVDGEISFTITITNTGPSTLEALPVVDHFFGPIEYVGGDPVADIVDNEGQTIAWSDLTEVLGDMEPGEVYRIETVFRLIEDADDDADGQISNTVTVTGATDEFGNITEDRSGSAIVLDKTPTAIDLLSFTAERQEQEIAVRWQTGAEMQTWGFHLWRSTDGNREHAEQVTTELILAQGRGSNATIYTWTDSDVNSETTYTYWLQEVELNGTIHEYGPATVLSAMSSQNITAGEYSFFMPIIRR